MKPWTRTKTTVAAVAVAGLVAVGAVVPALAQDADTTEETDETTAETPTSRLAEFAERLAEKLGLDADDVATAMEAVVEEQRSEFEAERAAAFEARLADAVAAGDLTQEQADAILAAHGAGVMPFDGPGRPGAGPGMWGGVPGFGPRGFGPPPFAGADAGADAGTDAGTDARTDAGADAGADADASATSA